MTDDLTALVEKVLELDAKVPQGVWTFLHENNDDPWQSPRIMRTEPASPVGRFSVEATFKVAVIYTNVEDADGDLIAYYRTAAPLLARHVLRLSQEADCGGSADGPCRHESMCRCHERDANHANFINQRNEILRLAQENERLTEQLLGTTIMLRATIREFEAHGDDENAEEIRQFLAASDTPESDQ